MRSTYDFIQENEQDHGRLKGEFASLASDLQKSMNEGWIKQDRENTDIRDKIESNERNMNLRVLKIENYIPKTLEGEVIK